MIMYFEKHGSILSVDTLVLGRDGLKQICGIFFFWLEVRKYSGCEVWEGCLTLRVRLLFLGVKGGLFFLGRFMFWDL